MGQSQDSAGKRLLKTTVSAMSLSLTRQNTDFTPSTEGRRPKWIPFVLKPTFLVFFFLVTIVMIALVEYLYQKSNQHQGLFFAKSQDEFTTFETFCAQYLLTIISVLYGMVWASVDLNIKRLEPFYQLSKGASAKNSLLLHYPFDFLAFVPVTAFVRKHWSVFSSGVALVLIFWVITPLQSALFATDKIIKDIPMQFVHYAELMPFEEQTKKANLKFFYDAYGMAWLDEMPSPFTMFNIAAMPFKPVSAVPTTGNLTSMTAITRIYQSGLDCTAGTAKLGGYLQTPSTWNVTNDSGTCSFMAPDWPGITRMITYSRPYTLVGNDCPESNTLFVAMVEERHETAIPVLDSNNSSSIFPSTKTSTTMTAVFCKSYYSYVDEKITVDADLNLFGTAEWGEPVNFTQKDSIIDIDSFERLLLTTGENFNPSSGNIQSYVASYVPSTMSRFLDWKLQLFQSPPVGYAIALTRGSNFESFQDPKVLARGMKQAHQLLFVNYLSSFIQNKTEEDINRTEPTSGIISVSYVAVVVIRLIARILEAFLAVVAICFAVLGFLSFRRRANLFGDPDSLAAKMSLVAYSKALLKDFEGLDESPRLKIHMKDRIYKLDSWDGTGSYRIDFEEVPTHEGLYYSSPESDSTVSTDDIVPTRPLALRTDVGISFGLYLAVLLGFLVFLYKVGERDGLPTFSHSPFWVQIIFSFVPTVLATGTEPFWVLITRYFCVYQPYTELFKGYVPAARSIGLKYTNIPPALVFFRALRGRHFIIFILSATALLANLLAVSLGGLFQNESRQFTASSTFYQNYSALIHPQIQHLDNFAIPTYVAGGLQGNNSSFAIDGEEHFMVANTNITQGTPLPSWIAKDYYFLPFVSDLNETRFTKAITRGYGGTVDCQPLENEIFESSVFINAMILSINITISTDDGRRIVCSGAPGVSIPRSIALGGQKISGQYAFQMKPANTEDEKDQVAKETCGNALVIGWSRGIANDERREFPNIDDTYTSTTLVCQPELKTGLFEVTVDAQHRVQEYRPVESDHKDLTEFLEGATMRNFTRQMSLFLNTYGSTTYTTDGVLYFQNDSTSFTFPHYLTEKLLNISLSDPEQPLANFDTLKAGYEDLYKRLIAIVFGLNADRIFVKEASAKIIDGTIISSRERAVLSKTMFYITAIILSLNIIVAVIAYTFRPKNVLPRFPDTLASEIAYFYGSQALQDVGGTTSMSSNIREKHLNALGHRYGYGYFIGPDGKRHRGVERSDSLL